MRRHADIHCSRTKTTGTEMSMTMSMTMSMSMPEMTTVAQTSPKPILPQPPPHHCIHRLRRFLMPPSRRNHMPSLCTDRRAKVPRTTAVALSEYPENLRPRSLQVQGNMMPNRRRNNADGDDNRWVPYLQTGRRTSQTRPVFPPIARTG